MSKLVVVVAVVGFAAGCTKWGETHVVGPKREVGRELIGSPSLAESKSSSLSAGFAGRRTTSGGAVAGLGANTESITLHHCVQQAQIQWEEPYDVVPVQRGRGKDIAGAIVLGIIGLAVIDGAYQRSQSFWDPGDPYYETPPSPVPGYIAGTAIAGAGLGLLVYSYSSLPKEPRPEVQRRKREWVETTLVESTGCNTGAPQVAQQPQYAPQPQVAPPASRDAVSRLHDLDQLKASGAISESDYARKRKEIIDGI